MYQVFSAIYLWGSTLQHSFAHPSYSEDVGDVPEATVALTDKQLIFKLWTLSRQCQVFLLIQVRGKALHKCGLPFIKQKLQAFKFSGAVTRAFAELPLSSTVKLALSKNAFSLSTYYHAELCVPLGSP